MPSTRWYYRETHAANFDVTTFDMTTFDTLNYSVTAGIAEIVLDRPPLNLIDEKSTREYSALAISSLRWKTRISRMCRSAR